MKGKTQMYVSRGRNQNNNVFLLSKKAKKRLQNRTFNFGQLGFTIFAQRNFEFLPTLSNTVRANSLTSHF